jgi:hypothetical protein
LAAELAAHEALIGDCVDEIAHVIHDLRHFVPDLRLAHHRPASDAQAQRICNGWYVMVELSKSAGWVQH